LYWSIILLAAFLVRQIYSRFQQGARTKPAPMT
jgi:hypothetical protein